MINKGRLFFYVGTITSALLLVAILSQSNYALDAFQIQLSLGFDDFGSSEFHFPPFGFVRARTHFSPLALSVSLRGVDLEGLRGLVFSGMSREQIYEELLYPARLILFSFILRLLFLAALGGGLGALVFGPRNKYSFLRGSGYGFAVISLLLVLTFSTFSPAGFDNLEYHGMLQAAPWMVDLAREAFTGVEGLAEHVQIMSTNLYDLLRQVENLGQVELEDTDLKVLHVSDIHNNPVALKLVERIVHTFAVDLVIDTGDITDFGSPLEAELLSRLDDLPVPYLIALGNHDSPTISLHLGDISTVTLLGGEIVEVSGLRILGVPDPAASRATMTPASPAELEIAREQLERVLVGESPDLLATHDWQLAGPLVGRVPVILHGHTHSTLIREIGDTIVINAGTSGGAGIRGLQSREEIPYTLVMLHFSNGEKEWRLIAADTIYFYYRRAGFEFRRTIFSRAKEGDEAGKDAGLFGPGIAFCNTGRVGKIAGKARLFGAGNKMG